MFTGIFFYKSQDVGKTCGLLICTNMDL